MRSFPAASEIVHTRTRAELIDVTEQIQRYISRFGVMDGYVIVYCPHTTAGITINENADPDVRHDVLAKLEKLIPQIESYYQHDEGNSDAHVKASLVGNSATVLIEQGRLLLGRWQGIYFCEFDGPRERRMMIKLVDLSSRQGE
jgi:secondary thiamine-phosphate synthase enzyme